jgi:hypothetical protein
VLSLRPVVVVSSSASAVPGVTVSESAAHCRGPGMLGTLIRMAARDGLGRPEFPAREFQLRSKKKHFPGRAGNSAACPRLGDQARRADLMGPVHDSVCSRGLKLGPGRCQHTAAWSAAGAGLCCVLYESGAASEPGTVPVPALATRTLEGTSATGRRRLGLACTGSSSHLNGPRWQAPRYLPSPTRTHPGRPRTPARA